MIRVVLILNSSFAGIYKPYSANFAFIPQYALTSLVSLLWMRFAIQQTDNKCFNRFINRLCPFDEAIRVPVSQVFVCAGQMFDARCISKLPSVPFMTCKQSIIVIDLHMSGCVHDLYFFPNV